MDPAGTFSKLRFTWKGFIGVGVVSLICLVLYASYTKQLTPWNQLAILLSPFGFMALYSEYAGMSGYPYEATIKKNGYIREKVDDSITDPILQKCIDNNKERLNAFFNTKKGFIHGRLRAEDIFMRKIIWNEKSELLSAHYCYSYGWLSVPNKDEFTKFKNISKRHFNRILLVMDKQGEIKEMKRYRRRLLKKEFA